MGSETELEQEINLFNVRRVQKQTELEDKEVALQCVQSELTQTSKKVEENDRKLHSLMKDRAREQDLYAEKGDCIQKMCTDLNISVDFDIRNSNDRAGSLVVNIRTGMGQVNEKVNGIVANNEKLDAEQEKEIQIHREEKARVESEIKSMANQLTTLEESLRKQKDELKLVEQSSKKLDEVKSKLTQVTTTREQIVATRNTQDLRGKIKKHREEKDKLSEELDDVDVQITSISAMATLLAQVATKEKHIEKRESEVRRIKNKHHDAFRRLFPNENIETGIKRKIESLNQDLRKQVNRLEAEVRLKEHQMAVNKNQLQNKKQELIGLENELRKLEEKIDRECDQIPFAEVLATTKENTEKYQMEYSTHKSSDVFYKR